MIQVENVSKKYALSKKQQHEMQTKDATVYAVSDISFACHPGSIYSLLGPNGAGKTTTLRMIATLLLPTSGTITVNGSNVVRDSQEVRRQIGFLTGSTHLYDRLTPLETVKYFADLHGMAEADFKRRKDMLFEQLGINDFLNKRIGQLSTGMKQKVSIARTMIHNPDVVIFDEPTSGLDVITANNIIELIRSCKAEAGGCGRGTGAAEPRLHGSEGAIRWDRHSAGSLARPVRRSRFRHGAGHHRPAQSDLCKFLSQRN